MNLAQKTEAETQRDILREEFLVRNSASTDLSEKLGNDASFRTYYRLSRPEKTLLMDSPAKHEPVAPFVKVAEHLSGLSLSSPRIFAKDLENNFLLIEDFGNDTFARLFQKGHNKEELYTLAVDALVALHNHENAAKIDIESYSDDKFIEETGRTINWYYPVKTGKLPSEDIKLQWVKAWRDVFSSLPKAPKTLVLRDYHCDNLMLVPGRSGIGACGLLDFQDALLGSAAYDLVSILENDRIDVPQELQQKLLERYLERANLGMSKQDFLLWYRVLSAQRQSKILGLFYRLPIRDDKKSYLAFIPQVCKLLNHSFKDEVLKPVAEMMQEILGDLTFVENLDYEVLRQMGMNDKLPLV